MKRGRPRPALAISNENNWNNGHDGELRLKPWRDGLRLSCSAPKDLVMLRGVYRSTRELEEAIRTYLSVNNRNPKPFVWTKSADEILASVARFCERISNSGH
jgi:hypothetical protein